MFRRSLSSFVRQSATASNSHRLVTVSPLVKQNVARGGQMSYRFYATETETASAQEGTAEQKSDSDKKIGELEIAILAKDKDIAELKDKYLRQVADFRNLQETTKREVQNSKDFAIQKFAKDLLDSVDNLDRALATVTEGNKTPEEIKEENKELIALFDGVKMTQQILEHTLSRHGLSKIDPIGEKFDPHKHEATFEVDQPDKEPGTVFFVQQTGFLLNNRVLRAAKVGVVRSRD
ncbi:GrpE-domain-containing protein [Lipomyces japonicus]|uniref:GrpE-domain-containing protein n=1 Tax=Lipomyces japonicus TaxID=56871 RepID=UPI0034CEECC1